MIIFHDPRCLEYSAAGHPERPARISRTGPLLQDRHKNWEWRKPTAASEEQLLRAHSQKHLDLVKNARSDFDVDTPLYENIFEHTLRSAGAAIEVARSARDGNRAFSLMRPPG